MVDSEEWKERQITLKCGRRVGKNDRVFSKKMANSYFCGSGRTLYFLKSCLPEEWLVITTKLVINFVGYRKLF